MAIRSPKLSRSWVTTSNSNPPFMDSWQISRDDSRHAAPRSDETKECGPRNAAQGMRRLTSVSRCHWSALSQVLPICVAALSGLFYGDSALCRCPLLSSRTILWGQCSKPSMGYNRNTQLQGIIRVLHGARFRWVGVTGCCCQSCRCTDLWWLEEIETSDKQSRAAFVFAIRSLGMAVVPDGPDGSPPLSATPGPCPCCGPAGRCGRLSKSWLTSSAQPRSFR
jgi:hypothetical protein